MIEIRGIVADQSPALLMKGERTHVANPLECLGGNATVGSGLLEIDESSTDKN